MPFSFHRIPIGICKYFFLRGERTVLIDSGVEGSVKAFVSGMDFHVDVMKKEIANFEASK
jgi:hypothetical protein